MNGQKRLRVEELQSFLNDIFGKLGMSSGDARYCADCIVQTNLWGVDSHGVLRLPIYVQRLARSVIEASPAVRETSNGGAFVVLDAGNGMGFLAGRAAMERAVELASQNGIGAVSVTNSNHFGAAALYAKIAADKGMIGVAMTNVTPNLVVPGGSAAITGNNPIAVGAPTDEGFPFLLDISMSAVAGGKLLLASKNKQKIPLDWATDRDGQFTDDPDKAFAGFLLPLGGHKGFGLSLVVDLLCGVLSGGAFQFAIKSMYKDPDAPSQTGHMMIAINPTVVMERQAFLDRMGTFYRTIKASPMWDGSKEMMLPGEIEHRVETRREEDGIPIPDDLLVELNEMAEQHGMVTRLTPL